MGRRSRRNRKGGTSSSNSPDSIEVFSGRQLFNTNGSANTVNTVNISPATFTRALAVADIFQFYRFTKIKVIQPPVGFNNTTVSSAVVHGFAPGSEFDTPPTTIAQIVELPRVLYHGLSKTMDGNLTLGRKDLLAHAQIPWFKTIVGTEDPQFEIQANLYNIASVATISYIIEYTVEFQSPNLAAQSPLERYVQQQQRLNLLSGGVLAPAFPVSRDPVTTPSPPVSDDKGSCPDASVVTIGEYRYVKLPKQ